MRPPCVAISSASAWRWPPDRVPTRTARRDSSPSPIGASAAANRARAAGVTARRNPRRMPRRSAMARFSSMVMAAQVLSPGILRDAADDGGAAIDRLRA